MYIADVHPILTYGSIVRWQALTKKYNRTELNRIQTTAYADAAAALQSYPAKTPNSTLTLSCLNMFQRMVLSYHMSPDVEQRTPRAIVTS